MQVSFDPKKYTILVVDDEEDICNFIADHLREYSYCVYTALSGEEALEKVLSSVQVDLVLSDINMPGMRGFEFLNRVKQYYPLAKRVLITGYNLEDYFELAIKHDVGNIFIKSVPFNFEELTIMTRNLLTSDVFGAERYMEPGFKKTSHLVTSGANLDVVANEILSDLPNVKSEHKVSLVLIELLTNAIFYGVRGEVPDRKDTWDHDFVLPDEQGIAVTSLSDSKKYAISIVDKGGKLKKQEVLYWLHRQIEKDECGLPLGIMDLHGRGIFIARKYIDRLIINIAPSLKTEVILINYTEEISGYKPLYINEL